MYVTYTPEETGTPQRWEFDPTRVRASKAEMIEKRYGEPWDQWQAAVQQGSMKARRVLLWHLMTQDHPTMRADDVPDFLAGEVIVEHTVAELREIRERVEKATMSDDEREPILAAIDTEITDAMAREQEKGVAEEGKAPSSSVENATPSPSPRPSEYAPGNSEIYSPPMN